MTCAKQRKTFRPAKHHGIFLMLNWNATAPGPFTVEVRMEKPVGLHGSRLRPIPGEKVKLGYRASKCRKTDRESLTWK